jgi:L-ascorbate metabolism protein UlaG (beta-lactamase superfamily)
MRSLFAVALMMVAWLGAGHAFATCFPIASRPLPVVPASFGQVAAVPVGHIRITFVGHASFLIESAAGVQALTDYNGYLPLTVTPDIVTMNNSHDSHYTDFIDDGIKHVLRGWDPEGGVARHNLLVRDMRIRNVPTNLTDITGRMSNGNSMFVFEAADLCVVHISHLHHVLSKQQVGELGRIDIAFAPIDGWMTMTHSELFRVLAQIRPKLIIPMHYGFGGAVEEFVAKAKALWPVRMHDSDTILFNQAKIPRRTEVLFLKGY